MKLILKCCLICCCAVYLHAQERQANALFNSLYGTTGHILTSNAYTVGKMQGNIGVFENFASDWEDNLIFNIGVHDKIEVGIHSEIPSHPNPKLNFLFKIRANEQGEYFGLKSKFIPATAFGINRHSAFAVLSYQFKIVDVSLGYNFSDDRESLFSNIAIQILPFAQMQLEYVKNFVSAGLRFRYKGITASLLGSYALQDDDFNTELAYWEVAYRF